MRTRRSGLAAAAAIWLLAAATARQERASCSIWCLWQRAEDARAARRDAEYVDLARQVVQRAPSMPGAVYALAQAYARAGDTIAALRQLHRVADLGAVRDPLADSAFARLRGSRSLSDAAGAIAANATPIVAGSVAFTLADPDHLPESIAWDSAGNRWLVGSLARRRVIQIAADGSASDFITDTSLLRVVGMHIDPARSALWIATWAPRRSATPGQDGGSETRLFKCDLVTGRVLRRYSPPDVDGSQLFNDLAIASNGDVYVTDTDRGWIYRVRADRDSLELFVRPAADRFTVANGITLSGDGRALYVAFAEGIARVDVRSGAVEKLADAERGSTAFADGLYWHGGGLIAVQHAPGTEQVARFELSPDGRTIARVLVLERGSAIMRLPTTGAVRGDRFYYVANSQYDRIGRDNRVRPADGDPTRSAIRVIPLALR